MKQRPVNLNFFTLHFPVTAWVSIVHRLSGFLLLLLIPVLLWGLQSSLKSEEHFLSVQQVLGTPVNRFGTWFFLTALLYHGVAGVRHLLLDLQVGESKTGGRRGAWLVLLVSSLLALWVGYRLW